MFNAAFVSACYVIHAGSSSEPEAYRLFLVLNDRGKELSEADLLKTRTMEILRSYKTEQRRAAAAWTRILQSEPGRVRAFLRAYYALQFGHRAPSKDLHRAYRDRWFATTPATPEEASKVAEFIEALDKAFAMYRGIAAGDWPFERPPGGPPFSEWQQSRLRRLVSTLRQDASIPLLMAATKGGEQAFARVVFLERFAFTYGLCGGHASSLAEVYFAEAKEFRERSSSSDSAEIQAALAKVTAKYVSEPEVPRRSQ